jgi:hypothetical protein
MMIWGTQVTPLQMFGYSIALGGLVYYKLGADKLKEYFREGGRVWADYGVRHPLLRKVIIFTGILLFVFLLLGGLAPTLAPDYDPKAYLANSRYVSSLIGDKAA